LQVVGEFLSFVGGVGVCAGREGEEEVRVYGERGVEDIGVCGGVEGDVFEGGGNAEAAGEGGGLGGEGKEFGEGG